MVSVVKYIFFVKIVRQGNFINSIGCSYIMAFVLNSIHFMSHI